jgi:hypothetical protein
MIGGLVAPLAGLLVDALVSAPVGPLGGRSKRMQLLLETGHRLQ